MTKQSTFLRWFLPAVLLYTVGFAVAAVYDLPIDLVVYTPGSLYGAVMEAFGWYPAFLPPILLALLWLTQPRGAGAHPWLRVAGGAVAAVGVAVLGMVSMRYLAGRQRTGGMGDPVFWVWVGLMVIFWSGILVFVTKTGPKTRVKLSFFALTGCRFLIAGQIAVYLIKFIWGRPRFDDMISSGTLENFRPWYLPFGPGGSSFPSGHTANAAGALILLMLCDLFPAWNRRKRLVQIGCWGYIAAMAAARILIGRHFLSDTLAASVIMGLIFYAIHNSKLYRKDLRATLEKAAGHPAGGPR